MADTREEWSAKKARRISRIAMCVPEALRGEYIAHMMVDALCRMDRQRNNAFRVYGHLVMRLAMDRINMADAKAQLSALVDRAQAGETAGILRRGKPAARLTPLAAVTNRVDVRALRLLAKRLPRQRKAAAKAIRELRDADRY